MKKKIILFVAIMAIISGIVLITNSSYSLVKADPGFDSSWGSGSSSSSSSSSWGSSSSRSSSTNNTNREDTNVDLIIISVGLVTMAVIFTCAFVAGTKTEQEKDEEIKYVLPAEEVHKLLGEKFDIE